MEEQATAKKGGKGAIVVCVILLLLLIGVSTFAVINMTGAKSKEDEIAKLKDEVAEKEKKITEIGKAVGIDADSEKEITVETVKETMGNHIILKDINYKLAIPDDLVYTSFFYESSDSPTLHLWGVKSNHNYQQLPGYANPSINEVGMGVVSYVKKGEIFGCIASCPEKLLELDGYDVFYSGPQQATMQDAEGVKNEVEDVKKIKDVLVTKDNYTKLD